MNRTAIIEHIGAIDSQVKEFGKTDFQRVYDKVYADARKYGIFNEKGKAQRIASIKNVASMLSYYPTNNPSEKLKWRARYTAKPSIVYFVCDSLEANWKDIEYLKDIYEDSAYRANRQIEVKIVTAQGGIEPTISPKHEDINLYDVLSTETEFYSTARRCAIIWADALGWTFSAPLTKFRHVSTPDPWQKRPDFKLYADQEGAHFTKISTKGEKFLSANHAVASEDECRDFYLHFINLNKLAGVPTTDYPSVVTPAEFRANLESYLECDYKLCPHCGRPIRIATDCCQWCDTPNEEVIETERYYDADEYDELEVFDKLDAGIDFGSTDPNRNFGNYGYLKDTSVDEESITHSDFATKKYIAYLTECKMRDNQTWTFAEANDVEEHDYNRLPKLFGGVPEETKRETMSPMMHYYRFLGTLLGEDRPICTTEFVGRRQLPKSCR